MDNAREVTVMDMMYARENRVFFQNYIREKYNCTIISFTQNIPGAIKVTDEYRYNFYDGIKKIREMFNICKEKFVYEQTREIFTGYEYYAGILVDAIDVKKSMIELEEKVLGGRIWDIDVISSDGNKIERYELGFTRRKCILCENEAILCARNRTHSVESLLRKINQIIQESKQ